ncbi:MAG: DUF3570 domain-containing protein [Gammaproteobacteria bacterium]|nr:DUF3570 domain-containing protein [Gammaproteobacteria bacterium]
MAVTEDAHTGDGWRGALSALTAAALALPGLAAAEGDSVSLDYHHYVEGERDLAGRTYKSLNLDPIEVDSLALGARQTLFDRYTLDLHYTQDTWAGASPVVSLPQAAIAEQIVSGASAPNSYRADARGRPVTVDYDSFDGARYQSSPDPRLVHLMASASAETRRQVDARLEHAWDRATLAAGGGYSEEPDYHSGFTNLGGSFDFNHKLTTLTWGASYTHSSINASLDANAAADWGAFEGKIRQSRGQNTLFALRHDVGASLGLTQVLNKHSLIAVGMDYTRASGYLGNPYKAVILAFDDPNQVPDSGGLRTVDLRGVLEQRPGTRNQWDWSLRYVGYVEPLAAALHADYRFFHDDWGIDAHTLKLAWHQPMPGGWMAIPGVRYYSQSRAEFYAPFFHFNQAYPAIPGPIFPGIPRALDFSQLSLKHFSSDARLAGFGSLTGELAVSRELGHGSKLELGAQYSVRDGGLKLGGGGEADFADFDAYVLYASLNIDLAAASRGASSIAVPGAEAVPVAPRRAPAGVTLDHLARDGGFELGYRYDYTMRGGGLQHGSRTAVDDAEVVGAACPGTTCSQAPRDQDTHVSRFEAAYGLSPRAAMLVSASFVNHDLKLRDLDGGIDASFGNPGAPRYSRTRDTGGLGDTEFHWLYEVFRHGTQEAHLGLGVNAPTGSVERRLAASRNYTAYSSQLGSGTWDFLPSFTYTGDFEALSFGGQLRGTQRLESANDAGYRLGNALSASAWGSLHLNPWLSASVRGLYANTGGVSGNYETHATPQAVNTTLIGTETVAVYDYVDAPNGINGPMDSVDSTGSRTWDVGVGLELVVPRGPLRGNHLAVEWLQPVADHFDGYQVERQGRLLLSWDLPL